MNEEKLKKIVFVCTGNTCRSPMAEYLLKRALRKKKLRGFKVCSAGLQAIKGDEMNPKSKEVLFENGIAVKSFQSTRLSEKLLREGFVFICMTERHKDIMLDLRWNAMRKASEETVENNVYSFRELVGYDVPDPYGMDIDVYRQVYALLEGGMYEIIEGLRLSSYALPPKPRTPKTANAKGTKKTASATKTENVTPKKRGRLKKSEK